MGYRSKVKTIEVKLTGEYEGFEATLRGKDLSGFLSLLGIGSDGEADLSDLGEQLRDMATSLIGWNLEDEHGTPVSITPEAVFAQDGDLMLAVVADWVRQIKGIPAPLGPSSTDGEQSLEASLPMAPLSESQAS